jgi:hypothetical protein
VGSEGGMLLGQMLLSARRAPRLIGTAANQFFEFGSAIFATVFVDRHDYIVRRSGLWDEAGLLAVGEAEDAEITPIQSEYGFDAFTVCKVHQRCIGKLEAQRFVPGENCGNAGEIGFAHRHKLKCAAMERGQELPYGLGVRMQKPCRLGDHRPTSQDRRSQVTELLDTDFMVFVGF